MVTIKRKVTNIESGKVFFEWKACIENGSCVYVSFIQTYKGFRILDRSVKKLLQLIGREDVSTKEALKAFKYLEVNPYEVPTKRDEIKNVTNDVIVYVRNGIANLPNDEMEGWIWETAEVSFDENLYCWVPLHETDEPSELC